MSKDNGWIVLIINKFVRNRPKCLLCWVLPTTRIDTGTLLNILQVHLVSFVNLASTLCFYTYDLILLIILHLQAHSALIDMWSIIIIISNN